MNGNGKPPVSAEQHWVELWNLLDRVHTHLAETAPDMLLTQVVYGAVLDHHPGVDRLRLYRRDEDPAVDDDSEQSRS